ncbi:hypothetical protein L873DRAFT_1024594 [Choiromyces venosus 120613-1]|uniref:Ankyrin n=1 Tax=Choiromyces venosus 120613-1 TaxID=1336337 RepID=A0A3N4JJN2_9PEZI|nr:hypothetical protein L873DRAFT_1024594 [Choiromyces venosus 120613-1]
MTAFIRIPVTDLPTPVDSQRIAVETLLSLGVNPLIDCDGPFGCPLTYAIQHLNADAMAEMMKAVRKFNHAIPAESPGAPTDLQWAISMGLLKLIQTPRSTKAIGAGELYADKLAGVLGVCITPEIIERFPFCNTGRLDLLGWACYYQDYEVLRTLESLFPNLAATFPKTFTVDAGRVSHLAVNSAATKVAEFLLPRLLLTLSEDEEAPWTKEILAEAVHHQPSLAAAVYGCFEGAGRAQFMLNESDQDGATALDVALEHGNLTLANFFIAEGATYGVKWLNPDFRSDGLCSTLAKVIGRPDVAEFRLELDPPPQSNSFYNGNDRLPHNGQSGSCHGPKGCHPPRHLQIPTHPLPHPPPALNPPLRRSQPLNTSTPNSPTLPHPNRAIPALQGRRY